MKRIGILGGTFNPLHIGHIRPAIEAFEALSPARIDLVPCASPPHKRTQNLLPFSLRVQMLHAAIAPYSFLNVNTLEAERSGPSYTYDTLIAYRKAYPELRPFFILGAGDFITLPDWHRGHEIPQVGDVVIMPRSGSDIQIFHTVIQEHWPAAQAIPEGSLPTTAYALPEGGEFHFLPQPRLDISSTLLREKWCAGQDISLLTPSAVVSLLDQEREVIKKHWRLKH